MPFDTPDESVTVETPNHKYANQMSSGRAMLPRFQGEKSIYDTAQEADQAAATRSGYEYDELRRDPTNQWYAPGTPAPPLLDVPGQSMHSPPAIGKQKSMQDPNAIVDQISSGLKTLSLDNLMKGNVDPQKQIEGVLNSGPGADAKARQQTWAPEAPAQPSFQTELGKPTAASLTATDAGQQMNEHVLGLVHNSSGAVMGANGTQYDKKAAPIQVAQMANHSAQEQAESLNGPPLRQNIPAQSLQQIISHAPIQPNPAVGKSLSQSEQMDLAGQQQDIERRIGRGQ